MLVSVQLRERIIALINKNFDVDFLGDAKWILGMNIDKRIDGSYSIHQTKYINDILNEYQMQVVILLKNL